MKTLFISAGMAALLTLSTSVFAHTDIVENVLDTDAPIANLIADDQDLSLACGDDVTPLASAEVLVDGDMSLACGEDDTHNVVVDEDAALQLACKCGCPHQTDDEATDTTGMQLALNHTTSEEDVIVLPDSANLA